MTPALRMLAEAAAEADASKCTSKDLVDAAQAFSESSIQSTSSGLGFFLDMRRSYMPWGVTVIRNGVAHVYSVTPDIHLGYARIHSGGLVVAKVRCALPLPRFAKIVFAAAAKHVNDSSVNAAAEPKSERSAPAARVLHAIAERLHSRLEKRNINGIDVVVRPYSHHRVGVFSEVISVDAGQGRFFVCVREDEVSVNLYDMRESEVAAVYTGVMTPKAVLKWAMSAAAAQAEKTAQAATEPAADRSATAMRDLLRWVQHTGKLLPGTAAHVVTVSTPHGPVRLVHRTGRPDYLEVGFKTAKAYVTPYLGGIDFEVVYQGVTSSGSLPQMSNSKELLQLIIKRTQEDVIPRATAAAEPSSAPSTRGDIEKALIRISIYLSKKPGGLLVSKAHGASAEPVSASNPDKIAALRMLPLLGDDLQSKQHGTVQRTDSTISLIFRGSSASEYHGEIRPDHILQWAFTAYKAALDHDSATHRGKPGSWLKFVSLFNSSSVYGSPHAQSFVVDGVRVFVGNPFSSEHNGTGQIVLGVSNKPGTSPEIYLKAARQRDQNIVRVAVVQGWKKLQLMTLPEDFFSGSRLSITDTLRKLLKLKARGATLLQHLHEQEAHAAAETPALSDVERLFNGLASSCHNTHVTLAAPEPWDLVRVQSTDQNGYLTITLEDFNDFKDRFYFKADSPVVAAGHLWFNSVSRGAAQFKASLLVPASVKTQKALLAFMVRTCLDIAQKHPLPKPKED